MCQPRALGRESPRRLITSGSAAPERYADHKFAFPKQTFTGIVKSIPLQRMATPADIAAVHAFLCSEEAGYITGQLLYVDGGVTLGV